MNNASDVYRYGVYGISVRSEIPLSLPLQSRSGFVEIELRAGSSHVFTDAIRGGELRSRSDWYYYAHLENGSSYVRWSGLGEFLVSSDGRCITFRRVAEAAAESFQVYLLGQALSFALVKSGHEPFHATVVGVDGEAVVLLGGSGFGKSSLAAAFLAGGHPLLTDDLLLLRPGDGVLEAYPGPARIKLFPGAARRFLGAAAAGIPMNPQTGKLVIPLDQPRFSQRRLPVRGIYALAPPRENRRARHIAIEPLCAKEAFMALVRNTFNYLIVDADRLHRQITETARIVERVPTSKLTYPRGMGSLPAVRDAILSHVYGAP
jgi:hypothetical protein